MRRSRPNRRNPRTTAVKRFIADSYSEVIERDENTVYLGERISDHCFYFFTEVACPNRPEQTHEVVPRGRSVREAQRKFFHIKNRVRICYTCEPTAQGKAGRKMIQDAMARIFHYDFDDSGYWKEYHENNPKGIL